MADCRTHHWGPQEGQPLFQSAGLVWRERGCVQSEGVGEHSPIDSLLSPIHLRPPIRGHLAEVVSR